MFKRTEVALADRDLLQEMSSPLSVANVFLAAHKVPEATSEQHTISKAGSPK